MKKNEEKKTSKSVISILYERGEKYFSSGRYNV